MSSAKGEKPGVLIVVKVLPIIKFGRIMNVKAEEKTLSAPHFRGVVPFLPAFKPNITVMRQRLYEKGSVVGTLTSSSDGSMLTVRYCSVAWQQLLLRIAPDFRARAAIDQVALILVIDTPYPLWYIYIE